MSPANREANRQRSANAMQLAWERAQAQQPSKAPAPKPAPAPSAPRFVQPQKPAQAVDLASQIAALEVAGRLDLNLSAADLAAALGTDVSLLSAAMVQAGYVRVRRGVFGTLHFGRKH